MATKIMQCKPLKALCISALGLLMMTLILNLIPLGGEWASVCREWMENTFGLN